MKLSGGGAGMFMDWCLCVVPSELRRGRGAAAMTESASARDWVGGKFAGLSWNRCRSTQSGSCEFGETAGKIGSISWREGGGRISGLLDKEVSESCW